MLDTRVRFYSGLYYISCCNNDPKSPKLRVWHKHNSSRQSRELLRHPTQLRCQLLLPSL
jgi:hypothetical protein